MNATDLERFRDQVQQFARVMGLLAPFDTAFTDQYVDLEAADVWGPRCSGHPCTPYWHRLEPIMREALVANRVDQLRLRLGIHLATRRAAA